MIASTDNKSLTLLVQNLRQLIMASEPGTRYPALETVLAKADHFRSKEASSDHFRFRLFGMAPDAELPIAALTRAAGGMQEADSTQYWLRTSPVTLWADMARVVMTSHGLAGLDEFECNEIII